MIPFVDLKAQYASIKTEIDTAIESVFETCEFSLGPIVEALEREFAAYCYSDNAIAVNSGTSALHLALLAGGIGPGDEVITTAFTFVSTVAAIQYCGARPVLVDINPIYYNLDPNQVEEAITPRTRAIIAVHLYGQPADMVSLREIADRHGLLLIEDAAQAHGAELKGQRIGSLGDLACFSFYPGKNLGAYGEAGMVVTGDKAMASKLRMLRDWGAEQKYNHVLKGFNYRMDALQGAVLRVKLRYISYWTEARRTHAFHYDSYFKGSGLQFPGNCPDSKHVYHIYAVRTSRRSDWMKTLHSEGISTRIHYPYPMHLLPANADLGYSKGDFPNAEMAATEVLSLPIFPELSIAQREHISRVVLNLHQCETRHERF